jgi:hypothetical protein
MKSRKHTPEQTPVPHELEHYPLLLRCFYARIMRRRAPARRLLVPY